MLDKISNIAPGSDYKNSTTQKGFKELFIHRDLNPPGLHDTLNYSSAWLFISQLNWQIKNFKVMKNEQVLISFMINDIEVQTEFNLGNISQKQVFVFTLSQKKTYSDLEKISSLILEKKIPVAVLKNNNISEYKAITKLFERVWNLNLHYELNDEECHLNTILDEIYEDVNTEFEFISTNLIKFIEKILNYTFSFTTMGGEENIPSLTLKKIKSANA